MNTKHETTRFPTPGRVYFMMTYADQALELPVIRSVICVGRNLIDADSKSNEWYFQDVVSYKQFGPFTDVSDPHALEEVEVHRLRDDALSLLLDFEKLIIELGEWQARMG